MAMSVSTVVNVLLAISSTTSQVQLPTSLLSDADAMHDTWGAMTSAK